MTRYVNLKFNKKFEGVKKVTLLIDGVEIMVSAKSGKWYTNLVVQEGQKVEVQGKDKNSCNLLVLNEKIFHPDQCAFDDRFDINKYALKNASVFYALSGNVSNPKKILITFPGISNFDNVNYRLSALTSLQERLKDTLIVAFQDKESVFGNYLFQDSKGALLRPVVISLISKLKKKYALADSDLIFYGNSKGGSIAIDYIEYFSESHFFIDIPQLDLFNYTAQNELLRYSLGEKARNYYNFTSYLPRMSNKRVTYSFAENDYDASRGLPMRLFPNINSVMLKDMGHSGSAMELVKRQFTKVIQLILNEPAIIRPPIYSEWRLNESKLYFSRQLNAFKTEKNASQVYAEVEFFNESSSYCVSLNHRFDETLTVFWQNGFDALRQLPCGEFKTVLHVYFKYKEFVYPLNTKIRVTSNKVIFM